LRPTCIVIPGGARKPSCSILTTEQGLCILGSENVVVEGMHADSGQFVLRHWPEIPKYGDITKLSSDDLERPDLLAGGFPCQDLSTAGLRAGLSGSRSGLWREFLRLIRGLRPRYVLVENVAALRYLNKQSGTTEPAAIATVLADLAGAGYDAEWASLYAYQFGYPHCRQRCFLVAYPHGLGLPQLFDDLPSCPKPSRPGALSRLDWYRCLLEECEQRICQSAVFREPPGFPSRPQRLKALGNAVMPDMARLVGECILRREAACATSSREG
jgi:DNA (cytosine-5)-methyltransferase 1